MTEDYIVAILGKDRIIAGHPIVCPNVNHLFRGQQDMISVNGRGMVIEYEIKISRSDFKRDARKGKGHSFVHHNGNKGLLSRLPNQFFYVMPKGLVALDEIPHWAGFMEISEAKVIQVKAAPAIHLEKHDLNKILKKVTTLYQQRYFLGCCLLTYQNRGIRERNKIRQQEYDQQREKNTRAILEHSKNK